MERYGYLIPERFFQKIFLQRWDSLGTNNVNVSILNSKIGHNITEAIVT